MERLPAELLLKIFRSLDYYYLATALQVCRKWRKMGSEDALWSELFKERWGAARAEFFAPLDSESWKGVFAVQDRCDRHGLGLRIIREGEDWYLIHRGEIQRHLGRSSSQELHQPEISDGIIFFIGELEAACAEAKKSE
ncbi:hypothetical protein AXF42_Ash020895 [Apostasia shenzhenica]|uniref:F-box protein n=1 Tax=Apostasia shenzhenica TaxID=1088818 RepID=A0A2I0AD35_9ASPA|nr:hypothetical protein AXF42_Ash020895 [Apostasia shenzhenica]